MELVTMTLKAWYLVGAIALAYTVGFLRGNRKGFDKGYSVFRDYRMLIDVYLRREDIYDVIRKTVPKSYPSYIFAVANAVYEYYVNKRDEAIKRVSE